MKRLVLLKFFPLWIALIPVLNSCGGMDETYKEFIEGGEIVYPGRADSVKLRPGYLRIEAKWELISDPTITHCLLIVDGRTQFDIPVDRSGGSIIVTQIVDKLSEGSHLFDIYTFDAAGNRSVKTEAVGFAYGANYLDMLYNRSIQQIVVNAPTAEATIRWKMSPENSIRTEISYTDTNGDQQLATLLPEDDTIVLEHVEAGMEISYQTVFLPEEEAIDTFSAVKSKVTIP